ncbi:MAG: hypothetical protein U1E13_12870, partial [Methylophilaceae bacterium]|nr:hypothetical protein [Methylophilaceae bacterium]
MPVANMLDMLGVPGRLSLLGQVVPLEKEQDLPKISLPGANTLTKAGGGAVTQGDGGAPRQVIVG